MELLKIRRYFKLYRLEAIAATRYCELDVTTPRRLLKMTADGGSLSIYEYQRSSRNTCFGASGSQCRALCRSYPDFFLGMQDFNMPFAHHGTKTQYVRRMRFVLRIYVSSESDMADLSCCCLPRPSSYIYQMQEVDTSDRDLYLEM